MCSQFEAIDKENNNDNNNDNVIIIIIIIVIIIIKKKKNCCQELPIINTILLPQNRPWYNPKELTGL